MFSFLCAAFRRECTTETGVGLCSWGLFAPVVMFIIRSACLKVKKNFQDFSPMSVKGVCALCLCGWSWVCRRGSGQRGLFTLYHVRPVVMVLRRSTRHAASEVGSSPTYPLKNHPKQIKPFTFNTFNSNKSVVLNCFLFIIYLIFWLKTSKTRRPDLFIQTKNFL